ncbi:hypothetical protein [Micromonospora sp. NPDC093277]|uniref:hypothetical protein n=1 Tax=Micromonospora sp. NPDC093277 TaxID=3364291 RepID=UPI00380681EC
MWLGAVPLLVGAVLWMVARQAPPVTVSRCVSADGPWAWLGVHLALLREHPDCAAGQYAVDAGPGHSVGLVVMVAAPALLLNLCTVLGLVGVWVSVRALLAGAAEAVGRLWPRLPAWSRLAPGVRLVAPGPHGPGQSLRAWQLDRSPVLRRGPPDPVAV